MTYEFFYQKTKELCEDKKKLKEMGVETGVVKGLDQWIGEMSDEDTKRLNPYLYASEYKMPITEVLALFGELRVNGFFHWYIFNAKEGRMISMKELQTTYKATPYDSMMFCLNAQKRVSNEQGGYNS